MMDNINSLLKNSANVDLNGFSSKLNLKDSDIVQIWDEVSHYIDRFMSQSKGVSMPGFGTFSFVQKKLDVGNNKFVLMQRPVFLIAEKFAQTHALSYTRYPIAGNIPVHTLNYSAIAQETAFSRDDIELCIKYILQIFNRSVAAQKNIDFTFNGIGKLQIRNSKVKMKFFKEFVNSVDSSGKAINDMQNRPHTADSVMSRNDQSRNQSRNTLLLPRLNSRFGAVNPLESNSAGAMDTIREGEENIQKLEELMRGAEDVTNESRTTAPPIATLFSSDEVAAENYLDKENLMVKNHSASDEAYSYQGPVAVMTNDESSSSTLSNLMFTKNEADTVNSILNDSSAVVKTTTTTRPTDQHLVVLARPSAKHLLGSLVTKSHSMSNFNLPTGATAASSATTCCSHEKAGQELCYLCHQRERRNIPVYLHEETRQRDQEESQLLAQYQHVKDLEKQLKDEEKRNAQRLDRARMDAFNLGVSEAVKLKQRERPKTSDISRSFIFRKRCKTPPKLYKQQDLGDYLSKQIEHRQREASQTKQEMNYYEKMEQMQLAEELAAQREAYIKEKYQRQKDLKSALDYQVRTKPFELPRALPDSEVFGQYDAKNEKLQEARGREVEALRFNKDKVEQRKREELLSQLREQEMDAENIERVKEEYRIDRDMRFRRMLDMRKSLETNWKYAFDEKKLRDRDEREHRMAHDGNLVHEQCDKYRRCAQCQKDLRNCGETNIWKETRYTAGSRIVS